MFTNQANSQIIPSQDSHNFGNLYPGMDFYVDVVFTNNTENTQFLLTIDKPRDVYYIFSAKRMDPDSSIIIRFKVNDQQTGRFSYDVDVYFSDQADPQTIRLSGNVKETSNDGLTGCPDFNSRPPRYATPDYAITILVRDSITKQPIQKADVTLVRNNEIIGEYKTDKEGIIHKKVPGGYYFLQANSPPYLPNGKQSYLNFQNNYVIIELSMEVIENPPPVYIDTIPDIVIDPPVDTIEIVQADPDPEPIPAFDNNPEFSSEDYAFNNITFILDVSSSMNTRNKFELMKLSLRELAKILRTNDFVSVLKFSSTVDIVFEHISGAQKDTIISTVNNLKTESQTAGGDAILAAYTLNEDYHIPQGNNLVIIITDGAFNTGNMNYRKTIKETFEKNGTQFSVVGIKPPPKIAERMNNIVKLGGGQFIVIESEEDAKTKLIAEIKRTAAKQ